MGREDSGTSDSTVGQEAVTQGKRHEGISLVCFSVNRSQPEDEKRELTARANPITSTHLGRMLTAYCELLWGC